MVKTSGRAGRVPSLRAVQELVVACSFCPRLVAHRERVAREKRPAFRDWDYWGRPLPGFGDPRARLIVIGLAPAAHGGNRTGRMFTGDRSGDWLFRALHRAGFANQPTSVARDDGLALRDCYVTAAVRCAPPDNQPTPGEFARCQPYLERELALLKNKRAVVALGRSAHDAFWRAAKATGLRVPRPVPKFAHGAAAAAGAVTVVDSYHPSQRNTQTGLLTEPMMDEVFERARRAM